MRILSIIILSLLFSSSLYCQNISLKFTASKTCSYVAFDSVKVSNLSFGSDTVLHYPDTVLTFYHTNIQNIDGLKGKYTLSRNYPNPFFEKTRMELQISEPGDFVFVLQDITGKELARYNIDLDQGVHSFEISGANRGLNFLTVKSPGYSQTIKLIQTRNGLVSNSEIQYLGLSNSNVSSLKASQENSYFHFATGNDLLITGYYDDQTIDIVDSPVESRIYHLDFDHPECPESVTDIRDGYIYPVEKIGCQCWMTENLRFLPSVSARDVGAATYEHYYVYGYNGSIPATAMGRENFETYGVLYNWHAAMQGLVDNQDDVRGVCPEGWRLPTDNDWKELEMRLGMTEQEAHGDGYRGTNQGSRLAGTMVHWFAGYITSDNQFGESGFNALPGGGRYFTGNFDQLGASAIFWTSSNYEENNAWIRSLHTHYSSGVYRSISNIENGFSVRCIKAD